MADNAEGASEGPVTFKVKASGEKHHTIAMSGSATVADLKTKLATEDFENIPVERQRLIYSGRVMKNEDTLASYKIKAGNTIHLVKSAASNPTPASSSAASQPVPRAIPNNMAAGTPADNQMAALTGARYAGHINLPSTNLFGADGGMGAPPSEDQLADMLSNPAVMQQILQTFDDPAMIDQMIAMNPMVRDDPNARANLRAMLGSPIMRQMLSNPDLIRSMGAMRRSMGDGAPAFPAPGATDNSPGGAATGGGASDGAPAPSPGGVGAAAANNPFLALLNPAAGQAPGAGQGMGGAAGAAANPFSLTPELLQQAAAMMGGGGGGGLGGFGAAAAPAAPADTRPPEERYADQLQQLNEMGFFDFDQNVTALRRSGGNVQGAVNFLLGG